MIHNHVFSHSMVAAQYPPHKKMAPYSRILLLLPSGHGAMKENYFLDDGAYAAVKIVIECVRRRLEGKGGIGELLAPLPEPTEAKEYRLKITVRIGCLPVVILHVGHCMWGTYMSHMVHHPTHGVCTSIPPYTGC